MVLCYSVYCNMSGLRLHGARISLSLSYVAMDQVLSRTVHGIMRYGQALRVLARLERGEQPHCRDALEDFTVGPSDPRLGLRGQRGVRVVDAASSTAGAEFSIPPNTPLLHYAGTVRAQAAFDELYQERGDANGYVFLLAGVPPGPLLALRVCSKHMQAPRLDLASWGNQDKAQ